ncbi:potassium channel family protein [Nocardiopsis potens]|uniref:potassium channel family protein n=1 Tax=Nocardiopsis potens TaxID=1246458 RepID=UPI00034D024F|nr:potassium channel family protein [Nocardiopsis potens]
MTKNLTAFLCAVALLQFGYPVTLLGELWTALYMLLYIGMIYFGIKIVRAQPGWTAPFLVLAAVFFACGVWFALEQGSEAARLGMSAALIAFQGHLIYSLLAFVFRRRLAPRIDLVLAAISVYLLLGGLFASAYGAIEVLWPGSFNDTADPGGRVAWQQLMYGSYVTLATLGYGDVVPVAAWARSLSALEGVAGTLFITTVIARLVGAFAAPDGRRRGAPREPRT